MGDGAALLAARDDGLLRYVVGFFMRREYKETERACRSPGAPGAGRVVVSCQWSVVSWKRKEREPQSPLLAGRTPPLAGLRLLKGGTSASSLRYGQVAYGESASRLARRSEAKTGVSGERYKDAIRHCGVR